MPRKGPVPKRDVIPDPKYGNVKKVQQKKSFTQL